MNLLLFLVLPALVHGEVSVYMDFKSKPNVVVDVRGSFHLKTSNEELNKTFNLNDRKLKKIVKNYSSFDPTDVYVSKAKSALFDKYKWLELSVSVTPKIHTTAPTCKNEDKVNVTKIEITSTWENKPLNKTEKVKFKIVTKNPELEFDSVFGENIKQEIEQKFESSTTAFKKCSLDIELKYNATLIGDVVANYAAKRRDHHYWAFDIAVMEFNGLFNRTVQMTELIKITYFVASTDDGSSF